MQNRLASRFEKVKGLRRIICLFAKYFEHLERVVQLPWNFSCYSVLFLVTDVHCF